MMDSQQSRARCGLIETITNTLRWKHLSYSALSEIKILHPFHPATS